MFANGIRNAWAALVLLAAVLSAKGAERVWELPFTGDVPRMEIETVDGAPVNSRTEYVQARLTLCGGETFADISDSVAVRGRGNTSWRAYPKKSYRLRFDHKQRLFGDVANRHYVLVANYIDPTLTVNAAALKAARLAGSAYAGHAAPVELYLNGEYLGSYLLTEKIRVGAGSVDIDRATGVLLELDVNYDEPQRFISSRYFLPVMVHYPGDEADEGETSEQRAVISEQIIPRWETFEETVRTGSDLAGLVDTAALTRYLFIYDLFCNNEVAHPKSIYCSYDGRDGRLVFGPVWDFDWSCGYLGERYFDLPFLEPFEQGEWFTVTPVADYVGGVSAYNGYPFFADLMHHPQVLPAYGRYVRDVLSGDFMERLLTYIDDYAAFLAPSLEHDAERWGMCVADHSSQLADFDSLKSWLRLRAEVLRSRSEDILAVTAVEPAAAEAESASPPVYVTGRIYIRDGRKILIR